MLFSRLVTIVFAMLVAAWFGAVAVRAQQDQGVYAGPQGELYTGGAALYSARQWKSAATDFQQLIKTYPQHPLAVPARFFLGECYLQENDYERAAEQYRDYVDSVSDDRLDDSESEGQLLEQATFRLAEIPYLADRFAEARAPLQQFLADHPNSTYTADALTYWGDIQLREKDYAGAAISFRRVIKDFPASLQQDACRVGLARALLAQGQTEEAERLLRAVAAKPESDQAARAWLQLGALQYAAGRSDEAIDSFRTLEENYPTSSHVVTARLGQGWTALSQRQFGEAQAIFRRAVDDPRRGLEARYWLAFTQRAAGQFAESLATLRDAATRDPDPAMAAAIQYRMGDIFAIQGEWSRAKLAFQETLSHPDSPWRDDALRGLVSVALHEREDDEVHRLADQFYREFPQSPRTGEVRRMEARAFILQERYDDANQVLAPLLATDMGTAQDAETRLLGAFCLEGVGQIGDAVALLLPALTTEDEQLLTEIRYTYAAQLMRLARAAEAIPVLETLISSPTPTIRVNPMRADTWESLRTRALGLLTICYAREGRLQEAKDHYAILDREHGRAADFSDLIDPLAQAADAGGDYAWAAELYEALQARATSPDQRQRALLGLGWCHYQLQDYETAQATFGKLLDLNPEASIGGEAAFMSGLSLRELRRAEEALGALETVAHRYPDSEYFADSLWQRARLHDELGQKEAAVAAYQRLAEIAPNYPLFDVLLYCWAWCLVDLDRPREAEVLFERLRSEHSESRYYSHALLWLAQRAFEVQDYDRAASLVDQLLAVGPDAAILDRSYYLAGQIQDAQGDLARAEAIFRKLLEECPQTTLRLLTEFQIADLALRQGNVDDANTRLQRLCEQLPLDNPSLAASILLKNAETLLQVEPRDWNGAYQLATRIAETCPDFSAQPDVDYVLGRCLASRAEFAEAREAFQRVVNAARGSSLAGKAQLHIGETYLLQLDYKAALRAYGQVEFVCSDPAVISAALLQKALCCERVDSWSSAAQEYERIIRDYPAERAAEDARTRLAVGERTAN